MGFDSNYVTTSTTLTAKVGHPVRQFFETAGVDVSEFPRLRFLVEVEEFFENTYSVRIPLRLPANPGWIHDLVFRVTRLIEAPKADLSGHQKLMEIECIVDEEPIAFQEQHLSSYFLTDVMECPNCRGRHPIQQQVLNSKTLQISCEQCQSEWTMSVNVKANDKNQINIITDQYFSEPLRLAKWIKNSTSKKEVSKDSIGKNLFSHRLERIDGVSWAAFGRAITDCFESKNLFPTKDFSQFIKSIFNFLALKSLEAYFEDRKSNLDETDVCRKSLLKDSSQNSQFELKPVLLDDFKATSFSNTSAKLSDLKLEPIQEKLPSAFKINKAAIIAFGGAALILISLFSYFFFERHQRMSKIEFDQALESVSKEAVEKKVASINPTSQEIKIPEKENLEPVEGEELAKNLTPVTAESVEQSPKEDVRPPAIQEKKIEPSVQLPPSIPPVAKKKSPQPVKMAVQKAPPVNAPAAIDPKAAIIEAGFRQGILHLKLQQAKEAAEEFERIIEIDPNHLESYRNLGLAYVYERRFEEAIKVFEKYISFKSPEIDYSSVEELIVTLKERVKIGNSQ
ncbi:MAG: tetratricopeptide repeat protein [Bdellovibrionota bacterium]